MDGQARIAEEQHLKEAVLRGEQCAWETLHERSFHVHLAWVKRRCKGDPETALEVVQESWMVAVRRIRKFDPKQGPFLGWLRGIAAKALADRARRDHRRQTVPLESTPATSTDLDERERVAMALSLLSSEHRNVLRAKYLERRSVSEIAEQLQRSNKGVESMLTRAREAFRTAWARV